MALENPLHALDSASLDRIVPRVPWNTRDFDGHRTRNIHEQALAERDNKLLEWIRVLRDSAIANVSPKFPFKEDCTLEPSTVEVLDIDGNPYSDFSIDLTGKTLPLSFIKDLKLILTSDFVDPYVSRIAFTKKTDPATNMIQVFIDLEISARLRQDQTDYVVLRLTDRAYNDVQDNTQPSSRDNKSFLLESLPVNGKPYFNAGVIEFSFLGSIQSQTESSWSVGTYADQEVEAFSTVPAVQSIIFAFDYQATKMTQLAYNNLGDVTDSVPFLRKVQNWPFIQEANAGSVLGQFFTDITITGPANSIVYLRRIRRFNHATNGQTYRLLFAYDTFDASNNYAGTVNIGVCDVFNRLSGYWIYEIKSLGSNTVVGIDPTWLDEAQGNTVDAYGRGTVRIVNFEVMAGLFDALVAANDTLDQASTNDQTLAPPPTIGDFPNQDTVLFLLGNSAVEPLAVDVVAVPVIITEIPVDPQIHQTRNVKVTIGGVKITRRIAYGNEAQMRNFYGISGAASLIDNSNIDPEDEWFDTSANALKRYQRVQGRYNWRSI